MTETEYLAELRQLLSDDGSKNILNRKLPQYTDTQLRLFLKQAVRDLNSGIPQTNYTLDQFPDEDLVLTAATIFSCIAEGILQLRNQVDYSDAGLSLAMFNKTGGYQGWAGFLMQTYDRDKMDFKRRVVADSTGAGFLGIRSQFSQYWGTDS